MVENRFFPEMHGNLGFGCMRLPMKGKEVDYEEFSRMADAFLASGFNYFDTAHPYLDGRSETAIRDCIAGRYERDSFLLANKLTEPYFNKEEDIRPFFEQQLKWCGVDYFDFYLMHAQNRDNYQKFKRCRAYETAWQLKQEGRIRHFGISFHDKPEVLDMILTEHPEIEVVQIQFNYVDYEDASVESRKVYETCRKHGKPVIVMEPVKGGSLVNLPPDADRIFRDLHGGSNASYALRFAAGFPDMVMVLSGMGNLEQMKDNLNEMRDFKPLSGTETEAVHRVCDIFHSLNLVPCTSCRYCIEENHCPKEIRIPDIFSSLNAHEAFHTWNSNFYYDTVITGNGHGKASDCIRCGKCETVCPQHLPIRELLQKAEAVFETKHGVMMQFFEWYLPADHSLWQRLTDGEAQALADAGFSALWLPPATKGAFGDQGVGYGVYDTYDLGEFDQKGSVPTKYGSKDQYLQAVKTARQAGLDVYADIVLNHRIGADGYEEIPAVEYAEENRTLPVSGEEIIKAWTVFDFKGRGGKYSDFIWDSSCFDGVDWDENRKKKAVFLLKGHSWQDQVDPEKGNYDYLMGADVDFDQPGVVDELTEWGKWYVRTTGISGFRLDAVKHIKAGFYRNWLPAVRQEMGDGQAFAVGEYWNPDVNALMNYLSEVDRQMSLFDVPLHMNLFRISQDGAGSDLRRVFDRTLVQSDPAHAVTFADNHDTQPGQGLQSFVSLWFKPHAYCLLLLREEGYPCVFYGDYYGIPHDGIPPMKDMIDGMIRLRRSRMTGPRHDYFNDAHGIGWSDEGGFAVVLSSKFDQRIRMFVGRQHAGEIFHDMLGNCQDPAAIDQEGYGDFQAKDGHASVWTSGPE